MTPGLAVVVACTAAVGAVGGRFAPRVVGWLPESDDPEDAEGRMSYADLSRVPGLGRWSAVASAAVCGVLGWRLGWSPALPMWVYLGMVGVVLAYVDWRTRLLPTRLVAPSYLIVGVLAALATLLDGDWQTLVRGGLGFLITGGLFFLLWFIYPPGMGYGDVRLSGVLGIGLGWLGWAELIVGIYAGFLLGALVGGLLVLLKVVDRRRYPYGPFMLIGALVGVLTGPFFAGWYAG
ncbi:MAG: prepilin peptidase [Propionibacteriales bacterium]|nr:prepilin peptidase [Propionibacteriales bacterium]